MKELKEIFDAIGSRVKSPLFGYFIISSFVLNWKAVFFLLFGEDKLSDRIQYFECHTTLNSGLWLPLAFAVAAALVYPWVNLAFLWVSSKPTYLRNMIHAESESRLLLKKMELEQLRNAIVKGRERAVIEKAKTEEELGGIQDEKIREKAKREIESVRSQAPDESSQVDLDALSISEFRSLPINSESLAAYSRRRFPAKEINPRIQELLLRDLDKSRYAKIEDINIAVNEAQPFLDAYSRENPKVFGCSTDFLTKALGYVDREFRARHPFAEETIRAMENFKSGGKSRA